MANTPAWFNKDYYLTSKLAQLRAAGETKYNNIVDVAVALEAAGFTAYEHFQQYSLIERTSPNPAFNATEYLHAKAAQLGNGATADSVALAIREAGMNLWEHFQKYGWKEGVNPSNSFDVKKYMESKLAQLQKAEPDAGWTAEKLEEAFSSAGIDPVSHYDQFGKNEEGVEVSPATNPVPSDGRTDGQTFTLTTGADNFTGTAGNDTFNGLSSSVAGESTINAADKIDGGAGKDTLNIAVTGTATATTNGADIKNIEVVNVRNVGTGAATLDASTVVGLTEAYSDRSTGNLTITNLAAGSTVGLKGNGVANLGTLTATYVNAATAANFTVDGGTSTTAAGAVTINGSAAMTSATITGSNGTNLLTSVTFGGGAAVNALTVDAKSNLTTGNVTGLAANTTITVKGAGAANIGTLLATNVVAVDASANTGGVTTVLNNVTGIKFTGGSGNDVVTTGAVLAGSAAVDAGAGTGDRLVVADSTHVTATVGKFYKGFEQLQVESGVSVDVAHLADGNTIDTIRINQTGTTATGVTNLSAAQAANVQILAADGTNPITIGVKDASVAGQIDTVKAALTTSTTTAGVATANNIDLTGLTLTGVEKLELTGNGTVAASTGSVTLTTANATSLDSITISNAGTNTITIAAGQTGTNLLVDASASTGNTTVNASAYNTSTGAQLLGGSGHDVLQGSARADNIVGGAGNDVIAGTAIGGFTAGTATALGTVTGSIAVSTAADILTGGEGRDVFAIGRVNDIANISSITDLNLGGDAAATGVDAIYFDLATTSATTAVTVVTLSDAQKATVSGAANLAAAVEAALQIANGVNNAVQFTYGADTYLAVNGANAGFAVADDALVKITGVVGTLDASDIVII